ncbi:hypothetical protein [Methanobrevibacter sp.]|uniref:hypothetical protein n=1 Tax=Methanobrevibacter sp. TaxID=66852 RepID=UPI00388F98B3
MKTIMFDGVMNTSELIALDCLMEDLSEEGRNRYIQRYKNNHPDKWAAYENHRELMGYPKL